MTNKPKTPSRNYPYSAWVVTSAYAVKAVKFVRKGGRATWESKWDITAEGRSFKVEAIHETKQAAIDYGREQIAAREEYLSNQHALLDVRRIKLDKAEAEHG